MLGLGLMVFTSISGFLALFLLDLTDSLKGETAKHTSYILGLIFMGGMILGFVISLLWGISTIPALPPSPPAGFS